MGLPQAYDTSPFGDANVRFVIIFSHLFPTLSPHVAFTTALHKRAGSLSVKAVMSQLYRLLPKPLMWSDNLSCRKVRSVFSLFNAAIKASWIGLRATFDHQSPIAIRRVLPALSLSATSFEWMVLASPSFLYLVISGPLELSSCSFITAYNSLSPFRAYRSCMHVAVAGPLGPARFDISILHTGPLNFTVFRPCHVGSHSSNPSIASSEAVLGSVTVDKS